MAHCIAAKKRVFKIESVKNEDPKAVEAKAKAGQQPDNISSWQGNCNVAVTGISCTLKQGE